MSPLADATGGAAMPSGSAPFPPHAVLRNFLGEDGVAALLLHANRNEDVFTGSTTFGGLRPSFRVSSCLHDFGDLKAPLREKFFAALPGLFEALRIRPVTMSRAEMELIAHGDGAFYKTHVDTKGSDPDTKTQRIISCVYYFHAQPKAFSGGELRLFPFGGGDTSERFLDIPPDRDTLVAFPSWAPHEVRPVLCPSRRFSDSRFAINCWFRCDKTGAADGKQKAAG